VVVRGFSKDNLSLFVGRRPGKHRGSPFFFGRPHGMERGISMKTHLIFKELLVAAMVLGASTTTL
jgi:hypothetical protein